jgi:hypothetical protein
MLRGMEWGGISHFSLIQSAVEPSSLRTPKEGAGRFVINFLVDLSG